MPRPKLKKMGNPNNQTVDAVRGVSAEAMRAKRLAKKTPAGQQDENRLVSYDPERVRAAIEAQLCPFCGSGPYEVLAKHTSSIHAVSGRELRDMAGLHVRSSICSPERSNAARERAISTPTVHLATEGARRGGTPKTWTSAGRAVLVKTIAENAERMRSGAQARRSAIAIEFTDLGASPEAVERMASERGISRKAMRQSLLDAGCDVPDAWVLAGSRRRRITDEQAAEMARLYQDERMSQGLIAERFGITQAHVSKILRRVGVEARPFGNDSRWADSRAANAHLEDDAPDVRGAQT